MEGRRKEEGEMGRWRKGKERGREGAEGISAMLQSNLMLMEMVTGEEDGEGNLAFTHTSFLCREEEKKDEEERKIEREEGGELEGGRGGVGGKRRKGRGGRREGMGRREEGKPSFTCASIT